MKLLSLRLEQLRQFRQPFELNDFDTGINLIAGPNESGKSTLVRAIRAAFFERHRSKIEDLLPWGDSAASPTVELAFEHDDSRWHLVKSFIKRKRCDLEIDGKRYSGEEAEEKLAELLGYSFAGKGASKAEHWGIPGLLWVEQGAGQDIEQAVEHAGTHLKSALDSLLGDVASTGGDDVIREVEARRAELLTAKGSARGEYAEAEKRYPALQAQLEELDARIAGYQQQVDRLGELRAEHQRAEDERPWEELQRRLEHSRNRYQSIETWLRQQETDNQQLESLRRQQQLLEEQKRQAETQAEQLQRREQNYREAQQALQTLEDRTPELQRAEESATEHYRQAERVEQQARAQESRQRLLAEVKQLEERLRVLDDQLQRARDHQTQHNAEREALQEHRIDAEAVETLRTTARQLEDATLRSQTVATRLAWHLDSGQSLTLNEQTIADRGEKLLLDDSELKIPGVGRLNITPGGEELGKIRRNLERLQRDYDEQLRGLQVASRVEAEQRLHRQTEAQAAVDRYKELLQSVAPQGIEQLASERANQAQQHDDKQQELANLPTPNGDDIPSLSSAEAAMAAAEQQLERAEEAFREHKAECQAARQQLDTAEREWQRLRDELDNPEHKQALQRQDEELQTTRQNIDKLEAQMTERQAQIDEANPDLLRQDIERFDASARQQLEVHHQRALELQSLQSRLETLGAEGLEEQRNQVAAELEHVHRRLTELERRAQALDRLLELLRDKRQALTRRLQAPLQRHLDHYLRVLFPGAELQVDEDLIPGDFRRGSELGPMAELSYGAREQMGLISRLAYADLLLEAGRPTLIILDDTLVHSDRHRMEPMKRILFDAAQRHQILLFTCHPENWQDLGVPPKDLQALKAEATA